MLRLIIAAALLLPALAYGAEPVPPELKVRDVLPGWTPVRPLTEAEMVPPGAPHHMAGGGFPVHHPELPIPPIPNGWIADWPTPPTLEATGVPWGWWWKPDDPQHFGNWIVVTKGRAVGRFYFLTTAPRRLVDWAGAGEARAAYILYQALRDREAKRRGVTPDALDREADLLVQFGRIPSVFETATAQFYRLYRQDRGDEGLRFLEMALEESVGTEAERARALQNIAQVHFDAARWSRAKAIAGQAKPLAIAAGDADLIERLDGLITGAEGGATMSPAEVLVFRGMGAFTRHNPAAAIPFLRQAEPTLAGTGSVEELILLSFLARALHATGEPGAEPHARRALKLAIQWEREEHIAEMKALLEKLSPPKGP